MRSQYCGIVSESCHCGEIVVRCILRKEKWREHFLEASYPMNDPMNIKYDLRFKTSHKFDVICFHIVTV